MAASEEIVIVYAYLDALEANARNTAEALASSSQMVKLHFDGTDEVNNAYDDFLGKWDKHRGDLHTGVTAAADAFKVVCQAFCDAEDELCAALE
jgi:hypothetical protein